MYEYEGEEVTLEFLQGKAQEFDMDFDSYIEKMKTKGLVEKTSDVVVQDAPVTSTKTTASGNGDSPSGDTSSESVGDEQVIPRTFPIEEVTVKPRIMSFEDFRKVPLPTFPIRLEQQQGDKLSEYYESFGDESLGFDYQLLDMRRAVTVKSGLTSILLACFDVNSNSPPLPIPSCEVSKDNFSL